MKEVGLSEAFGIVDGYMRSGRSIYSIKNKATQISDLVAKMSKAFSEASSRDGVVAEASDADLAIEVMLFIQAVSLEIPITQEFSDFVFALSLIVYNWNSNFLKNERVAATTNMASRYVELHLTSVELVHVMKSVSSRARRVLESTHGGYEMSRHFAESLADKVRSGGTNAVHMGEHTDTTCKKG